MTFDGDKPFLLVEETANIEEEMTIVPTYGEPFMLMDTFGSLTDNSLTWTTGGIEYYLVSDVMSQDELLEVAQSISVLPKVYFGCGYPICIHVWNYGVNLKEFSL